MAQARFRTSAGSRPDELDRSVLLITLGVWGGHFVLVTTAFQFVPTDANEFPVHATRGLVNLVASVLCLGIYLALRRWGGVRPWPLLFKAFVACLPLSVGLMLLYLVILNSISDFYQRFPHNWMDPYLMLWNSISFLWILLAWAAMTVGARTILEVRRRDAQLAAAHSAAQQAQLLALRLQINPHFLFNTLNTLAGLVVLDRRHESERVVLNLSRFLRHTLTRTPTQFVPLADEVDMLRMYLDIEIARFPDRLQVEYEIGPGCESALVPSLLLLPLAENSVKYALANAEDGIRMRIGASREGDALLLWVEDEGHPPEHHGEGLGIGLANVRQQLTALFGDAAQFQAGPTATGWRNRMRIPWQEASA
jgi:two-component system, LytTR family, sensor kinase